MKRTAQFLWDLWPVILFYLVVGLIVVFGVLQHPEQWAPAQTERKPEPFMPNGSDTVPNKISCQFRGSSFCHPKEFHV